MNRLQAMQRAHELALKPSNDLNKKLHDTHMQLLELQELMQGSEAKNEVGEQSPPNPNDRMMVGMRNLYTSTHAPTKMHEEMLSIGKSEFIAAKSKFGHILNHILPTLEAELNETKAPPIQN